MHYSWILVSFLVSITILIFDLFRIYLLSGFRRCISTFSANHTHRYCRCIEDCSNKTHAWSGKSWFSRDRLNIFYIISLTAAIRKPRSIDQDSLRVLRLKPTNTRNDNENAPTGLIVPLVHCTYVIPIAMDRDAAGQS